MQCPLCDSIVLCDEELVENLSAKVCRKCQGRWIQSFQYWKWLDAHGDSLTEKPFDFRADFEVKDSGAGKLCPECGHFLTHNEVGHGVDFYLDRCNNCGGIWFDKNEWEVLVSRKLHDQVHYIFSAAWQKRIRQEGIQLTYEERIRKIVGEDGYNRLAEIAEWIIGNEHKSTMISYLQEKCRGK